MSTFLFVQSSNLSIKLSGYTASIFTVNGNSIGDNMLTQYVTYTDAYKVSDEFKKENIGTYISNNTFTNKKCITINLLQMQNGYYQTKKNINILLIG